MEPRYAWWELVTSSTGGCRDGLLGSNPGCATYQMSGPGHASPPLSHSLWNEGEDGMYACSVTKSCLTLWHPHGL